MTAKKTAPKTSTPRLKAANTPIPNETKADYVAWLLDPERSPRTQGAWAEQHGIHEVTVSRWRHDDYVLDLLKRASEMLEPLWARIMATLIKIATDPDHMQCVQAAREVGKLLKKYPSEKLDLTLVDRVAYVPQGALRDLSTKIEAARPN